MHEVDRCRPASAGTSRPPTTATESDDGAAQADASVSYRRSERTTIYVRTQEGDTVRLEIKLRESVDAQTAARRAAETDGDESPGASTQIALAGRASAKIALFVAGNLNEAERGAIAAVLDQRATSPTSFSPATSRPRSRPRVTSRSTARSLRRSRCG
jgi:hypothetical protein